MTRPLLDLIREQIEYGLQEAGKVPLISYLGAWLQVIDDPPRWKRPDVVRQYGHVAEAGAFYAASRDPGTRTTFLSGLSWLSQRRFFVPDRPAGLEADPLALLGLALGVDAVYAEEDVRTWLSGLIHRALKGEHDRQRSDLLGLALALATNDETDWSQVSPLLQAAVSKKGKVTLSVEAYHDASREFLDGAKLEPEWAVLKAAAWDTLSKMAAAVHAGCPTVEDVVRILKGIPAALKRWPWESRPRTQHASVTPQRWDIQHEYHVQSLLWAVLRPVFPDLEDEENLPSLGHKHPRADLLIRSLRLIIEVKYLREARQSAFAKIIDEVSADTGLYLTPDSGYDQIIAFVWDATGSTPHHDELIAGIRKLTGVADVVVVSRPGIWERSSTG